MQCNILTGLNFKNDYFFGSVLVEHLIVYSWANVTLIAFQNRFNFKSMRLTTLHKIFEEEEKSERLCRELRVSCVLHYYAIIQCPNQWVCFSKKFLCMLEDFEQKKKHSAAYENIQRNFAQNRSKNLLTSMTESETETDFLCLNDQDCDHDILLQLCLARLISGLFRLILAKGATRMPSVTSDGQIPVILLLSFIIKFTTHNSLVFRKYRKNLRPPFRRKKKSLATYFICLLLRFQLFQHLKFRRLEWNLLGINQFVRRENWPIKKAPRKSDVYAALITPNTLYVRLSS